MNARPGVVVVGTGFGAVTHVRALRRAGFEVVALMGRDPTKTAERAAAFEVPVATTSFDEALGLPGVDAVTVATPPHTHAALALAAIDAGKHVLCEKPFARDTAEGLDVLRAAEAAGIVHLLGTEFRWDAGQATLARTVRNGMIGAPTLATVFLHVPLLAAADAETPAWWADEGAGGGWFGAHGSQVIDQLRVTVGELVGVSASLLNLSPRATSADDGFVVRFRTAGGVEGVMQSTCGDWGPMFIETRVTGTAGSAWIDGVGAKVLVADNAGTRQITVGDDLPDNPYEPLPPGLLHTAYERMTAHGLDLGPYTGLATEFRRQIAGEPAATDPRAATFLDGVRGMAVLDAVRASAARGGAWVDVQPVLGS